MDASRIGAIFDCDGTLVDSMGAWRGLETELAHRAGAELTDAQRDHVTTLTLPECSAFFHEQLGLGESNADVLRMIGDYMLDFYTHRAKARPDALNFVEGLAEAGVRMAIASSTPQPCLRAAMESCGFAPFLRAIVSVDDVGRSKREPAVYDRARALLGTPPETTWGVEDSIYAIRTLAAAGYRTLGIHDDDISATSAQLAAECEHAIESFTEIDAQTFLAWNEA